RAATRPGGVGPRRGGGRVRRGRRPAGCMGRAEQPEPGVVSLPRVLLVTGTGTGVGKTVVTAAVATRAGQGGRRVAVVKPVQTGVSGDEPGDAAEVARLAAPAMVRELARLPEPLAPQAAARRAGIPLPPLREQARRIGELVAGHDLVLVEGSGGLLVRLDDD